MRENSLSVSKTIRGNLPKGKLPLLAIKNAILGKNYELSLVFIGTKRSRTLNRTFRKKDKPTNILSFSLDKNSGEIFITPALLPRGAREFDESERQFLGRLLIHGCLHLKGMVHGSRMERLESKFRKKFIF